MVTQVYTVTIRGITALHFDNTANGTPANVKAEFLLNVGT